MHRAITGYLQDDAADWVALLCCGHRQHVRHKPPFFSRPWTQTEAGRRSMLGQALDCVLCDRRELPQGLLRCERTPELGETGIPEALRTSNACATWTVIHVVAGRLRCHIEGLADEPLLLDAQTPGVVPPDVRHALVPDGPVRFSIERFRLPAAAPSG